MTPGHATELTPTERIQLAMMMQYDGWKVFVEKILMPRARLATEEVIKVAPDADLKDRAETIAALQLYAYGVNRFVSEVIKDMNCQQAEAKNMQVAAQQPYEA
jgi:hypothetical protein